MDTCRSYSMIIIGTVKKINSLVATTEENPFNMQDKERYYLCTMDKPEHMIIFEEDNDHAFTDFVF